MTKIICLAYSCTFPEGIYKKDDVTYCYNPRATGSVSCGCNCCHPVEEWNKE